MSANEVIEQIELLSDEDRQKVVAYFTNGNNADVMRDEPGVRYMDASKAKAVSAEIFSEHAELFRKLAS